MDAVPLNTNNTNARGRGLTWGFATLVATAWMISAALPASADEFAVGIVVESSAIDSDVSVFMEGFQLAVDQSPDVSHPPGAEGGDHLGGMDVVMITIGGDLQGDELLSAAVELVETDRVPIIVVDAKPDLLDPLVDVAIASGTMLIVLSDVDGEASTNSPLVFAAADQDGIERLLTDRKLTFEDVFFASYGRPPSPTAVRGYLAGRLVDISVEATNRDPFDTETLVVALAEAAGTQAATATTAVEDRSDGDPAAQSGDDQATVLALVAVTGLALAGAVHIYWAAGGTWPGSDRSDLARKVVGSTDEFPSTATTMAVAVLLVIGAIVVGGATGLWVLPASDDLVTVAAWVVGGVLIARAVVGFVLSGRRQASGRGTPFSIRDLAVYSPLTLVLGASTVLALVSTT